MYRMIVVIALIAQVVKPGWKLVKPKALSTPAAPE
jgi:hypothetical protein